MNVVIATGKSFTTLKNYFSKEPISEKINQLLNIVFIGNETQYNNVNEIIKTSENKIVANTNSIENLQTILQKNNANTIIFSDDISNKLIIEHIEILPKKYLALFYQAGATSIIGSNDKNERGIFIAKK